MLFLSTVHDMKINPEVAEKYPHLYELVFNYDRRNQSKVFWEAQVQGDLTLVKAMPNKLIWEFEVKDQHCNR